MRVCSECRKCYDDEVLTCTDESHPTLSDARQGSCEMIAGYRLESLVTSAADDDLFRAHRLDCGRTCLIRIFRAEADVLRDAQSAATLFHPGIVDIYEAGHLESGEIFVVTEDLDGKTLRDLLTDIGPPALLTSVEIVLQVAEALHALHLKGQFHGALRPENIILTTDPANRLLVRIQNIDFGGIAERSIIFNKFLIDSAVDALKYFAPEQCFGDGKNAKSDVYSLGIVFYELLAGVPPFDAAKAAALIEMHKSQRPPDIRVDDFDLRMLVTHSVMEALQKQPDKRQGSANAFARQMRHIMQLATHVSTPPPAGVVPSASTRPQTALRLDSISAAAAIQPHLIDRPDMQTRSVTYDEMADLVPPVQQAPPEFDVTQTVPFETVAPGRGSHDVHEAGNEGTVARSTRSRLRLHRKRSHIKDGTPPDEMKRVQPLPPTDEIDKIPVSPASARFETGGPTYSKIVWEQPEDDIPSVADVRDVLSGECLADTSPEPYVERATHTHEVIDTVQGVDAAPNDVSRSDILEDEEEITVVTTRRAPVSIPVQTQQVVQRQIRGHNAATLDFGSNAFFPTLLSGFTEPRPAAGETGNSIFSSYYTRRSSVPYRGLIVGGCVVLLIAVFISASDSLNRYVGAWSTDDVASKTIPDSESGPRPEQASSSAPSTSKPLGTDEKAVTAEAVKKVSTPKAVPVRSNASPSGEKRESPAVSSGTSPDPSLSTPLPRDGVTQALVKPAKVARDKKPLAPPVKAEATSRPRIVKDPRP